MSRYLTTYIVREKEIKKRKIYNEIEYRKV